MNSPAAKEKDVTYWCRSCKAEVHRRLWVAFKVYESFCATAGKPIKMRRRSWRRIAP